MSWNRRLWRIAQRIETAYQVQRRQTRIYSLPETSWDDVRNQLRRFAIAENCGWERTAARERESTAYELERTAERLRELGSALRRETPFPLPSVRDLYEELMAVVDEFGEIEFEESVLSVSTTPIILEGIRFGRFSIRLDFERLTCDSPYSVVALDPNPAACSDETTHPHVNSESLCAGEGRAPIAAALRDGRIGDFFMIVNRVLNTYAPGNAYTELDRWQGIPCHECDCLLSEDDTYSCSGCIETICGDCLVCCNGCSASYCSGCIDRCRQCDESYCSGCLSPCSACGRELCSACLEDGLCANCIEEANDESNEEMDEPSAANTTTAADVEI